MIRISYSGNGPGGLYGFEPTSKRSRALLLRKCPDATWLGPTMYVEQRYAMDVAVALEGRGEKLVHAPSGKRLHTFTGGFTIDREVA